MSTVIADISRSRNARAFTLTELLVVMSVLAIVAGITLPAVSIVRASAQTSSCANNLRQVGMAISSYAGDNRMSLPSGYSDGNYVNVSWDDRLSAYDGRDLPMTSSNGLNQNTGYLQISAVPAKAVRLFGLYTCPADKGAAKGVLIGTSLAQGFWSRTYAFNGDYSSDPSASKTVGLYCRFEPSDPLANQPGVDWAARMTSIPKLSEKIMLAETLNCRNALGRIGGSTCTGPDAQANDGNYASTMGFDPVPLHRSKWNYLMCDARVALLAGDETRTNPYYHHPGPMWRRDQ